MSSPIEQPRNVIPAHLGFLAIYNPSLGTSDENLENQIVYYSSSATTKPSKQKTNSKQKETDDAAARELQNEQLRQIGLAQGMVEFGRSFSDGRAVDTVETEKSRIVLHQLEAGWWILASINLTVLPVTTKPAPIIKGKTTEPQETVEYSSREVKPAILLLGDLLRAHSTFLLHHASSMSALFVRTRRSKFVGILGRYWDAFTSTWNVLMHGNPATSLYGGIKIAACGELGVGVGEEERGSGEREVLEGFFGRIDGLVDVIVSKFGGAGPGEETPKAERRENFRTEPTSPWLGSGSEPAAEDGAIFLGTGALSRKSLRDVSHWIEDLYRWGPYAYGVLENPTSTRRSKRSKRRPSRKSRLSTDGKEKSRQAIVTNVANETELPSPAPDDTIATIVPQPVDSDVSVDSPKLTPRRPSFRRGTGSRASTDSESKHANKFVRYLKFGYGTHWTLGGTTSKADGVAEASVENTKNTPAAEDASSQQQGGDARIRMDGTAEDPLFPMDDSRGHYLIGLMGDVENETGDPDDQDNPDLDSSKDASQEDYNSRLLLRTLTLELEREQDARAEAEISIDLGHIGKESSSMHADSEHTGTTSSSYESQDRNKTKKLRVVVYANRPFIFVFLFELRTDVLTLSSLYRSLHYQLAPLIKPLLTSTTFRASRPDITHNEDATTPIYDLIWDPKLLTINSTIPNIPDPYRSQIEPPGSLPWSRIEALNTHMQIVNTYVASTMDRSELERTGKTSRGWWVVWTRIPEAESKPKVSLASGDVKIPGLIHEDSAESETEPPSDKGSLYLNKSRAVSTAVSSTLSGPAHPFLDISNNVQEFVSKDKEIFLIRRASDHMASASSNRLLSGSSFAVSESGWTAGPSKLAQGIGVDTNRYIEGLLNLSR